MALRWMEGRLEDSKGSPTQTESPSSGDKLRVIIVGGSIAGLACARALLHTGVCEVVVLEKAKSLSPAGAGLGLDKVTCDAFKEWGLGNELLSASRPLDQERSWATNPDKKEVFEVCKDEDFRHQALHWSDVHRILYDSLPPEIVHFGHEAKAPQVHKDDPTVSVTVSEFEKENTKAIYGDVIVAADGSGSTMRELYWPGAKRRYSGYCAWRGVLDGTGADHLYAEIKSYYPNMGECLYFELGRHFHAGIYELQGKRVNWIWYINRPEPELQGASVTIKPDKETVAALHRDADRNLTPTLAKLIRETPKPFINVIYDREPPQAIVGRRMVLVGEAAHATTPHAVRSTNMSVGDAYTLGKVIKKYGPKNIDAALVEYQSERLPTCVREVLFSRHLGQLKQGLIFDPIETFPWRPNDKAAAERLLIRNMQSFQIS